MSALVYSKNLESRFDSAIDTFLSKAPQNISDMQAVTSYNTTGLIDELYSLTPLISKDSGFFSQDGDDVFTPVCRLSSVGVSRPCSKLVKQDLLDFYKAPIMPLVILD